MIRRRIPKQRKFIPILNALNKNDECASEMVLPSPPAPYRGALPLDPTGTSAVPDLSIVLCVEGLQPRIKIMIHSKLTFKEENGTDLPTHSIKSVLQWGIAVGQSVLSLHARKEKRIINFYDILVADISCAF